MVDVKIREVIMVMCDEYALDFFNGVRAPS